MSLFVYLPEFIIITAGNLMVVIERKDMTGNVNIFCLFFFAVLSVTSCAAGINGVTGTADPSHAVHDFQACRKKGNRECMEKAFHRLVEEGVLKKGMTAQGVTAILGRPQHFTGIYIPGGYSYGFGNWTGNSENYPDYYWIHFKERSGKGDSVLFLEGWD